MNSTKQNNVYKLKNQEYFINLKKKEVKIIHFLTFHSKIAITAEKRYSELKIHICGWLYDSTYPCYTLVSDRST